MPGRSSAEVQGRSDSGDCINPEEKVLHGVRHYVLAGKDRKLLPIHCNALATICEVPNLSHPDPLPNRRPLLRWRPDLRSVPRLQSHEGREKVKNLPFGAPYWLSFAPCLQRDPQKPP